MKKLIIISMAVLSLAIGPVVQTEASETNNPATMPATSVSAVSVETETATAISTTEITERIEAIEVRLDRIEKSLAEHQEIQSITESETAGGLSSLLHNIRMLWESTQRTDARLETLEATASP